MTCELLAFLYILACAYALFCAPDVFFALTKFRSTPEYAFAYVIVCFSMAFTLIAIPLRFILRARIRAAN